MCDAGHERFDLAAQRPEVAGASCARLGEGLPAKHRVLRRAAQARAHTGVVVGVDPMPFADWHVGVARECDKERLDLRSACIAPVQHRVEGDAPLRLEPAVQVQDGRAGGRHLQRVGSARGLPGAVVRNAHRKAHAVEPIHLGRIEQRTVGDQEQARVRMALAQSFGQWLQQLPVHQRLTAPELEGGRAMAFDAQPSRKRRQEGVDTPGAFLRGPLAGLVAVAAGVVALQPELDLDPPKRPAFEPGRITRDGRHRLPWRGCWNLEWHRHWAAISLREARRDVVVDEALPALGAQGIDDKAHGVRRRWARRPCRWWSPSPNSAVLSRPLRRSWPIGMPRGRPFAPRAPES